MGFIPRHDPASRARSSVSPKENDVMPTFRSYALVLPIDHTRGAYYTSVAADTTSHALSLQAPRSKASSTHASAHSFKTPMHGVEMRLRTIAMNLDNGHENCGPIVQPGIATNTRSACNTLCAVALRCCCIEFDSKNTFTNFC